MKKMYQVPLSRCVELETSEATMQVKMSDQEWNGGWLTKEENMEWEDEESESSTAVPNLWDDVW